MAKLFKIKKKKITNLQNNIFFNPITPLKLLESDYLVPFQLFMIKKSSEGIWGQIQEKFDNKNANILDERKKKAALPLIKYVLETFIINFNFDFDKFYNKYGFNVAINTFILIVSSSLKYFRKQFDIPQNNIINIDFMAKRYGKTPIEIFCSDSKLYNDLDALCFNFFICNTANQIENEKAEKLARKK